MASLYTRRNSPNWWIRFKDPTSGRWKSKATQYRRDNPQQTKEARARCAANTAQELSARKAAPDEKWDSWVGTYLDTHCQNPITRQGYNQSWLWLRSYLQEAGVSCPAQLAYQHAYAYLAWRMKRGGNKNRIRQSTALRDIKLLRLLMTYAVRAGMATGNPCLRMGIRREAPKEKAEFTDAQIQHVYHHLPMREKDWRYVAFRIALETGCRLSETEIAFENIDFERKTITFVDPKGGRPYTVPLPNSLVPLLKKIQATGAPCTVTLDKKSSTRFSNFLRRIGLATHSFHCTRVTHITRLARAGVPLREAMRMVNHSSETVHKIYLRLGVEDVRPWANRVKYPQPK